MIHLPPDQLAVVVRIVQAHLPSASQVFVFGSRATGRNLKPFSDLDICIRGKAPLDTNILANLATAFEQSDLPIKVDLVDWSALTGEFQSAIVGDLQPLPGLEPVVE